MLTTEEGQRFFRQCAEALSADPRGEVLARLAGSGEAAESGVRVPKAWRDVKDAPLFDSAVELLQDGCVRRLLALPFPSEAALTGLAATVETPEGAELLVKAIEEKIGKPRHEASGDDLARVTELNLSTAQVADLTPLQGLTKLQTLDLSVTQAADLTPLRGLATLQSLNLSGTQVADLIPSPGERDSRRGFPRRRKNDSSWQTDGGLPWRL